jgi:hypothetical protein
MSHGAPSIHQLLASVRLAHGVLLCLGVRDINRIYLLWEEEDISILA